MDHYIIVKGIALSLAGATLSAAPMTALKIGVTIVSSSVVGCVFNTGARVPSLARQ